MRLVFEKFEAPLLLNRDTLNVLRIEDPSLYSRCAISLAEGFLSDSPEPACFFSDENREISTSKILFYAGDPLSIDLNDRRIVSQAIKVIVERLVSDNSIVATLERMNFQMEDVLEGQIIQMSGDYAFHDEWDASKYLKLAGFGVDCGSARTVYERLCRFVRVMADLFPDKVIAFVNLPVYLTESQYNEFCELVVALQLCVLSYEKRAWQPAGHLENVLYIDKNYLER